MQRSGGKNLQISRYFGRLRPSRHFAGGHGSQCAVSGAKKQLPSGVQRLGDALNDVVSRVKRDPIAEQSAANRSFGDDL
jgi:hypothetical protein